MIDVIKLVCLAVVIRPIVVLLAICVWFVVFKIKGLVVVIRLIVVVKLVRFVNIVVIELDDDPVANDVIIGFNVDKVGRIVILARLVWFEKKKLVGLAVEWTVGFNVKGFRVGKVFNVGRVFNVGKVFKVGNDSQSI